MIVVPERVLTLLVMVVLLVPLYSCKGEGTLGRLEHKQQVLEARQIKDTYFKNSPESPLLDEQQWRFSKLSYFPVDFNFRVKARVTSLSGSAPVVMVTSSGHERVYVPRLRLDFFLAELPYSLVAYQEEEGSANDDSSMFVPFTDLTTGDETYASGRYLDVTYAGEKELLVDFNFAYNPYCAYNYNYSCPIPPPENHLKVRIQAGELLFRDKK